MSGNRQPPSRVQAGWTSDFPYGPLADCGAGNPFFYHVVKDDFDNSLSLWTTTASASSTIALSAGDGGIALFTPNTGSTDYAYLQSPVAAFVAAVGAKLFFLCRFTITAATMANPTVWLGLMQHQASGTPAPTDGIYFTKANASSSLALVVNKTSTPVSTAIPSSTITTAVAYDAGFYLTVDGSLKVFFGQNLVGWQPQSGSGASTPVRGAQLRISTPILPTAALSPMLGILAGNTAQPTLKVDFVMVAKER
jgi:hypothetical protein